MLFVSIFFFFNDTATTEIYTLSLHDALPILELMPTIASFTCSPCSSARIRSASSGAGTNARSEEHTSELQSRRDLVCRLLLEKKKQNKRVCHANRTSIMHMSENRHSGDELAA